MWAINIGEKKDKSRARIGKQMWCIAIGIRFLFIN